MNESSLTAGRSLVVCVGPGGVGKTSIAAALALRAAEAGRRAFVLTVDPARRLGQALGLDALDDATHVVDGAGRAGGRLAAAMVDTAGSFDALVGRIVADPAAREHILQNRVVRAVSRTLARSHAYVAMERLHWAMHAEDHDLVVLDTPPATSAIEILDAPNRLARLLDSSVVSWLMPARADATGLRHRLAARGGEVAASLLERIVGPELVAAISEFLGLFADLRPGFSARARAMNERLTAADTRYVLVTTARPAAADDAARLAQDLAARGIEVDAIVVNDGHSALVADRPEEVVLSPAPRAAFSAEGLPEIEDGAALLEALAQVLAEAIEGNRHAQVVVDALTSELPRARTVVRVPHLSEPVHDLPGLSRLAARL